MRHIFRCFSFSNICIEKFDMKASRIYTIDCLRILLCLSTTKIALLCNGQQFTGVTRRTSFASRFYSNMHIFSSRLFRHAQQHAQASSLATPRRVMSQHDHSTSKASNRKKANKFNNVNFRSSGGTTAPAGSVPVLLNTGNNAAATVSSNSVNNAARSAVISSSGATTNLDTTNTAAPTTTKATTTTTTAATTTTTKVPSK